MHKVETVDIQKLQEYLDNLDPAFEVGTVLTTPDAPGNVHVISKLIGDTPTPITDEVQTRRLQTRRIERAS